MSTVRLYRWDDAGAPVLSGTVGSLTNLLRACLVGSSGIAYGGKPAAGWTEVFAGSATNTAVYRNNDLEGFSGCCVRVADNAGGTGGGREALLSVYAYMSSIDEGGGATRVYYIRKSSTLNAAARKWALYADGGTAILNIWDTGDSVNFGFNGEISVFGDYDSFLSSGSNRYIAAGKIYQNYAAGGGCDWLNNWAVLAPALSSSMQVANPSGVGTPINAMPLLPCIGSNAQVCVGSSGYPPPGMLDGSRRFMGGPFIRVNNYVIGRMRGIHLPTEYLFNVGHGELVPGSDRLRVMRSNSGGTGSEAAHVAIAVDGQGPW